MVSHPVATFFAALTVAGITGLAGAQVAADFLDLKMLGSYKSAYAGFLHWGYQMIHSIFGFFIVKQPAIGVPPLMETPIKT